MQIDGCGGKTITMAAQFEYDRIGFEGYLGNVGKDEMGCHVKKMRFGFRE